MTASFNKLYISDLLEFLFQIEYKESEKTQEKKKIRHKREKQRTNEQQQERR
jgi:hypothetical protein